jgi:RNA polymerase sigma-70 factor (ECF subfamily)
MVNEELLERARQGDSEAFCAIAEQYGTVLFRQACGLAGNPAVAEDITAETMVEAWRSIHRYDGTCKFSTWLFAILLHRYKKHLRSLQSRPIPASSLPLAETEERAQSQASQSEPVLTPSQALIQQETRNQLRDLLNRLPEGHRDVLMLRFFESASLDEIASALGCPIGTVKSRLHYALEELRTMRANLNL